MPAGDLDGKVRGGELPKLGPRFGRSGKIVLERSERPHDIGRAAGDIEPSAARRPAPAILGVQTPGPDLEGVHVEVRITFKGEPGDKGVEENPFNEVSSSWR